MTDSVVIGAIGLPVTADSFVNFDCGTIPSDSIVNAIQSILSDAAAADGMTTAMVNGYWELIAIEDWCAGDGSGGSPGLPPSSGEYPEIEDLTISADPPCYTTFYYQWVSGGTGVPDEPPPPPGGEGGGGGGGDEPPPPPPPPPVDSNRVTMEWDPSSDHAQGLQPPDCSQYQPIRGDQWWCSGRAPKPSERQRIDDALNAMRAIGGVCSTLADTVAAVLSQGTLRLHASGGTGFASRDSEGSYMTINLGYATEWYDSEHKVELADENGPTGFKVDLQFVLAHEAEHLLNLNAEHLGTTVPGKWKMAHTDQCSGLAGS